MNKRFIRDDSLHVAGIEFNFDFILFSLAHFINTGLDGQDEGSKNLQSRKDKQFDLKMRENIPIKDIFDFLSRVFRDCSL